MGGLGVGFGAAAGFFACGLGVKKLEIFLWVLGGEPDIVEMFGFVMMEDGLAR